MVPELVTFPETNETPRSCPLNVELEICTPKAFACAKFAPDAVDITSMRPVLVTLPSNTYWNGPPGSPTWMPAASATPVLVALSSAPAKALTTMLPLFTTSPNIREASTAMPGAAAFATETAVDTADAKIDAPALPPVVVSDAIATDHSWQVLLMFPVNEIKLA